LENASFSVAALEKYCNARCKKCVLDFKSGKNKTALIGNMNSIISELTYLLQIKETAERVSLIGSAYKRKGMVTTNIKAKSGAYSNAALQYKRAYEIKGSAYTLNNWIVMQTVSDIIMNTPAKQIVFGSKTKAEIIAEVVWRKEKLSVSFANMDYWQLVDDVCYDFSLLMLDDQRVREDGNWKDLEKKYIRLWRRSGSKGKRIAEIENFEIISDALSLSTSKPALRLKARVDNLRKELENILQNDLT